MGRSGGVPKTLTQIRSTVSGTCIEAAVVQESMWNFRNLFLSPSHCRRWRLRLLLLLLGAPAAVLAPGACMIFLLVLWQWRHRHLKFRRIPFHVEQRARILGSLIFFFSCIYFFKQVASLFDKEENPNRSIHFLLLGLDPEKNQRGFENKSEFFLSLENG